MSGIVQQTVRAVASVPSIGTDEGSVPVNSIVSPPVWITTAWATKKNKVGDEISDGRGVRPANAISTKGSSLGISCRIHSVCATKALNACGRRKTHCWTALVTVCWHLSTSLCVVISEIKLSDRVSTSTKVGTVVVIWHVTLNITAKRDIIPLWGAREPLGGYIFIRRPTSDYNYKTKSINSYEFPTIKVSSLTNRLNNKKLSLHPCPSDISKLLLNARTGSVSCMSIHGNH